MTTDDGIIVFVNAAVEKLTGLRRDDLIASHVSAHSNPANNAKFDLEDVLKRAGAGDTWKGIWRHRTAHDEVVVTRAVVTNFELDRQRHFLFVHQRVPQEPDKALRDGERRLALAAEAAQLGIWDWDLLTNAFTYSAKAREICGFTPEQTVGYDDVVSVTHPDDYPRTLSQAQQALDPNIKDNAAFEYRIVRPDGAERWVIAHGYAVFSDDEDAPRALRYVGTLQDITESRRLKEAENAASQHLRLAMGAAHMAVWQIEIVSGRIAHSIELNRLFGFADDATPSNHEFESRYAPGVADMLQQRWAEIVGNKQRVFELDYEVLPLGGGQRWLEIRGEVEYGANGEPVAVAGIIVDGTERRSAVQALRESNSRFREAADSAPAPVWMTNASGQIEFVNQAMAEFAGRPRDELLQDVWLTHLHPDDAPLFARRRAEAWAQGHTPYVVEARFRRSDGQWRWLEVSSKPRRDGQGAFHGYVGLAVDRTETRRAMATLRESEERFRLMSENAPVMIWMSDPRGHCLHLNRRLREFWNVEVDKIPLFDWSPTVHPDDAARVGVRVSEAIALRQGFSDQARYRNAGGEYRTLLTEAQPRFSDDDDFLGMLGVNVDITDAIAAQHALKESEARFRLLADSVPAAIWTADAGGRVQFLNRRWRDYSGIDTETSLNNWPLDVVHPEDQAPWLVAWTHALSTKKECEVEVRARSFDGQYRWFLARAAAVQDDDGLVVEWFGTATDIHDRKMSEEYQKLLLDELNHRVKNTLTVVQALAQQTFRDEYVAKDSRSAFDGRLTALAGAHHLLTQTNWEYTSLQNVVTAAAHGCAAARDRLVIAGPPITLSARQAISLTMALHELCTNAVKYGALSNDVGIVQVSWHSTAGASVTIAWRESGGPSVAAPTRRGFGTQLVEGALAHELKGTAVFDFAREGVVCEICIPLDGKPKQ